MFWIDSGMETMTIFSHGVSVGDWTGCDEIIHICFGLILEWCLMWRRRLDGISWNAMNLHQMDDGSD